MKIDLADGCTIIVYWPYTDNHISSIVRNIGKINL